MEENHLRYQLDYWPYILKNPKIARQLQYIVQKMSHVPRNYPDFNIGIQNMVILASFIVLNLYIYIEIYKHL